MVENEARTCMEAEGNSLSLHQLPASAIRLIGSAQVITSITSAVKELIENSADAVATSIDIKLENYGFDKIEVRDNGKGVSPLDVEKMARPHFTSKISSTEDLKTLTSYGFRGEALGSLSAVSQVCITTKTSQEDVSMVYTVDLSGHITSKKPSHLGQGTTVAASNLFHNLPVRKQFYSSNKKRKDELRRVEDLVITYSVIRHDVRFTLRNDKTLLWQTSPVARPRDVLFKVWGSSVMPVMQALVREKDEIRIEMFLPKSKSETVACRKSGSERTFTYVNKRPVLLKEIDKLVKQHFTHGTENDRAPLYFISIMVPPDEVDVNLEPNKTRVFLHDQSEVMNMIKDILVEMYGQIDLATSTNNDMDSTQNSSTDASVNSQDSTLMDNSLEGDVGKSICKLTLPKEVVVRKDRLDKGGHKETVNMLCKNKEAIPHTPSSESGACLTFLTPQTIARELQENGPDPKHGAEIYESAVIEKKTEDINENSIALSGTTFQTPKTFPSRNNCISTTETTFTNMQVSPLPGEVDTPECKSRIQDFTETSISDNVTFDLIDDDFLKLSGCLTSTLNAENDSSFLGHNNSTNQMMNKGDSEDQVIHHQKAQLDSGKDSITDRQVLEPGANTHLECLRPGVGLHSDGMGATNVNNKDLLQDTSQLQDQNQTNSAGKTGDTVASCRMDTSSSSCVQQQLPIEWTKGSAVRDEHGRNVEPVKLLTAGSFAIGASVTNADGNNTSVKVQSTPTLNKTKKVAELPGQATLYDIIGGQHVKRPTTAYIFYSREVRPQVVAENPNADFQEVARIIGKMWHGLSKEEKSKYENKMTEDVQRYKEQTANNSNILNKDRPPAKKRKTEKGAERRSSGQRRIPHTIVNIQFSLQQLAQNFTRLHLTQGNTQTQPETSQLKLIGPLKSHGVWVGYHGDQLFMFNPCRAQEVLIYHRLMETHTLPANPLEEPIVLNSSQIGGAAMWLTLQQLPRSKNPTDPYEYYTDSRLLCNGFKLRQQTGLEQIQVEITAMAQNINTFGVADLVDILKVIHVNPGATVACNRPAKVKNFLQGEAVRMARALPSHMTREEAKAILLELKQQLPTDCTTCFHNKAFLAPLYNLSNIPLSQDSISQSQGGS